MEWTKGSTYSFVIIRQCDRLWKEPSARSIASSSGASSNGLNRTATASDCAASERVLASVRPVISIAGRPRPEPCHFRAELDPSSRIKPNSLAHALRLADIP